MSGLSESKVKELTSSTAKSNTRCPPGDDGGFHFPQGTTLNLPGKTHPPGDEVPWHECEVYKGTRADYAKFKPYHFLKHNPSPAGYFFYTKPHAGCLVYNHPCNMAGWLQSDFGRDIEPLSHRDRFLWGNLNLRIISRVIVLPEYRHKGIARHMIESTRHRLIVPYIGVILHNRDLLYLFVRAGFHTVKPSGPGQSIRLLYHQNHCVRHVR